MKTKILGAALLAGVVFSGSYVLGQQGQSFTPEQQKFVDLIRNARESSGKGEAAFPNYTALAQGYMDSPNHEDVASYIILRAQADPDKISSVNNLLSLQVAQNQKLIEQNAQLVQLLKANAAKGK